MIKTISIIKKIKFFLSALVTLHVLVPLTAQGTEDILPPSRQKKPPVVQLQRVNNDSLGAILATGESVVLKIGMDLKYFKEPVEKGAIEVPVCLFLTDFALSPIPISPVHLPIKVDCEWSALKYVLPDKPSSFENYKHFEGWLNRAYFTNENGITYNFDINVKKSAPSLVQYLRLGLTETFHITYAIPNTKIMPDHCNPGIAYHANQGTLNTTTVTFGGTLYFNKKPYPIKNYHQVFPHPVIEEVIIKKDSTKKFYYHRWLAQSEATVMTSYKEFPVSQIQNWPGVPSKTYSIKKTKPHDKEEIKHLACFDGKSGEEVDISDGRILSIDSETFTSQGDHEKSLVNIVKDNAGNSYVVYYHLEAEKKNREIGERVKTARESLEYKLHQGIAKPETVRIIRLFQNPGDANPRRFINFYNSEVDPELNTLQELSPDIISSIVLPSKAPHDKGRDRRQTVSDFRKPAAPHNETIKNQVNVSRNEDVKPTQLYHEAAAQGNSKAQYNLALIYANGYTVKQDETKALQLYHESAKQGHPQAQYHLGVMYEEYRGLNNPKAMIWYQKAAEQGYAPAQRRLQEINEQSQMVDRRQTNFPMTTVSYRLAGTGDALAWPFDLYGFSNEELTGRRTEGHKASIKMPLEVDGQRVKRIIFKDTKALSDSSSLTVNVLSSGSTLQRYLYNALSPSHTIDITFSDALRGSAVIIFDLPNACCPDGSDRETFDPREVAVLFNLVDVTYKKLNQSQTLKSNVNPWEEANGADLAGLTPDIWYYLFDFLDVTDIIKLKWVSKVLSDVIKEHRHLYLPELEEEREDKALSVLLGESSFSSLLKRGMLTPYGLKWLASYPGFFPRHFRSVYPFNVKNPRHTDKIALKSYIQAFQAAIPHGLLAKLAGFESNSQSKIKYQFSFGKEEDKYNVVPGLKLLMAINPLLRIKNPIKYGEHYTTLMNSLQIDDNPEFPPCKFISTLYYSTAKLGLCSLPLNSNLWVSMMPALIFVFDHLQEDTTINEMQRLNRCIKMMQMAELFQQHIDPRILSKWNVIIVKMLESWKGDEELDDFQSHVDDFLAQRAPDSFDFYPFLQGLYARPLWATSEHYFSGPTRNIEWWKDFDKKLIYEKENPNMSRMVKL